MGRTGQIETRAAQLDRPIHRFKSVREIRELT
jgi:hypothetical protein